MPLAAGYEISLWRPSLSSISPPTDSRLKFVMYWLMFYLGVFRSRNYFGAIIKERGKVVHSSFCFPAWFRFPFMGHRDVQIGAIWTSPS
ncbi:MAG: hypothetical protein J0M12_14435, partial [Deltaproteobacteria bacterium]|nr:hypothetical protein [Deltaproteobacteria bacterium]